MSDLTDVRRLASALPEVTELDHHGMPSFRIRGKIIATVPDDAHIRIMLDENQIRAAAAEHPSACSELYWGRKLSCVLVELSAIPTEILRELLTDAWLGKAPTSLAREFHTRD